MIENVFYLWQGTIFIFFMVLFIHGVIY